MVATELAQRYAAGESLRTLSREYHMDKRHIAKTIRAMGGEIRPSGICATPAFLAAQEAARIKGREARRDHCQRCEILVRFDPGQNGYCGECWEEVSHAVVPADSVCVSHHLGRDGPTS